MCAGGLRPLIPAIARTAHAGLSYNAVANVSRDANGDAYTVQYYPTISRVAPGLGSLEGGTNITLLGDGFVLAVLRTLLVLLEVVELAIPPLLAFGALNGAALALFLGRRFDAHWLKTMPSPAVAEKAPRSPTSMSGQNERPSTTASGAAASTSGAAAGCCNATGGSSNCDAPVV